MSSARAWRDSNTAAAEADAFGGPTPEQDCSTLYTSYATLSEFTTCNNSPVRSVKSTKAAP
jgi:hypothetical protein